MKELSSKRLLDLFLSWSGLILASPLFLFIAICIYLEDRGSVFFQQKRVGKNGKSFTFYKFRSMKIGADRDYPNVQAYEHDPRVTRVGKWLRATAMDELPQLWNIFKGDMSFVGPRALLAHEVEIHSDTSGSDFVKDLFEKRCAVRPGLTGVAQIYAQRDIPRSRKFRYDLFYIRKQSFGFDLKLISLSFWISFVGKWESREDKISRAGRGVRV